jgi:hypothetical protein
MKMRWEIQTEQFRYWPAALAWSREAQCVRFEVWRCLREESAVVLPVLRALEEVRQPRLVLLV